MTRPQTVEGVLFGELPNTVKINGADVEVLTDFRTWLHIGEILRSGMSQERMAANIISLCYPEKCGPVGAAFGAALAFYYDGFPHYGNGGKPSAYSAYFDGKVIYSGFMKCYGLNLSEITMHWHQFAPLLCELEGCCFSEILKIRSMDLSNLSTDSVKIFAEEKRRFALPYSNSDAEFANTLTEVMK